ncbi:alpha/beta hydrolase [Bradyrhizobium canariense]|uniref:Acetyl esterase/lipase n=1 Tax=Bradyrhizobium canariense TaxID=255045 RepID=A0A1H1X3D1_9BRAD|nr:alpha/beta hydrolase [Bradyrhizobium canariense]SDT03079.1 Acetyl esterase/lipase [Bradyrhizobium canariense]
MTVINGSTYEVLTEDLEFGRVGDAVLLARLYRPKGVSGFPAIVDVHGGAWTGGDRLNNAPMHEVIAAAGTAVLALDFRLAPAVPYPGSVADINLGIRWLKANVARWGGNAELVGGLGTSSGAHQLLLNVLRPRDPRYLALPLANAADVDANLAYLILCWPISDPVARYRMARATGNDRLVNNHHAFFGTEETMAEANPQHIVESGSSLKLPPALLIQGTNDANVTPDMADRFAAAYAKAGGQITLRKFKGQPHTFIPQNPTSPASVEALHVITDFIRLQTR